LFLERRLRDYFFTSLCDDLADQPHHSLFFVRDSSKFDLVFSAIFAKRFYFLIQHFDCFGLVLAFDEGDELGSGEVFAGFKLSNAILDILLFVLRNDQLPVIFKLLG
jgi:hypothetical protein